VTKDWPFPGTKPAHKYRSSACTHHAHEECGVQCKYCDAKCTCACHVVKVKPAVEPSRLSVLWSRWSVYGLGLLCAMLAGVIIGLAWRMG
jgi:hypothetical protein